MKRVIPKLGLQEMKAHRCGGDPRTLMMETKKMVMTTEAIKKPALEFCLALHPAPSLTMWYYMG